ncbi:FAD-binding protein [Litorivivens sp.]|uniref:FAD-binding protein n=1 Tax=Litorivivens sp. TaxID=2020868 RepID=UPI003566F608
MAQLQHSVDLLVVGSGAGAMTAALRAAHAGLDVLMVEKAAKYGGTSATSGGGLWIPCNHLMPSVGIEDSREKALTYLKQLCGDDVAPENLEAFVDHGPRMLTWLEQHSEVRYMAMEHYADYYQELDGAAPGGRSIDPFPYQAQQLGDDFLNLQDNHVQTKVMGMMGYTNIEGAILLSKSPGWFKLVLKLAWEYFSDIPGRLKSRKSRRLTMGNALIGRLRRSLLDQQVPLWLNSPARKLLVEDGRVCGAVIEREGETVDVRAKAVVLGSGGFEHSQELREQYLPQPTRADWSSASPTNTGDMLLAGLEVGAATHLMDEAWWGPSITLPGEDRSRQLFTERSMPGCIMVNKAGKRFFNESVAYTTAVQAMQKQGNTPAYVIFDSRYKREYPFGPLLPDGMHLNWLQPPRFKQLLTKADSIDALADSLGVDKRGLSETVERFNQFAAQGKDEDFNRGENAYDLLYGDVRISPNPCLAPIKEGPFYAMEVYPGDIGTKGGLLTNASAQVLNKEGEVIEGLYAIGNTAASVTGRYYPGAGATLGPAMTFGFVAAEHIAREAPSP